LDHKKITRRFFIGLGALFVAVVMAALGAAVWMVRRECKRNHSVKGNPTPDDHFRQVFSTRRDPPDIYNLDVTTVDSTSAVVTWASAEAAGFEIEAAGDDAPVLWTEGTQTRFHSAELKGLDPDTEFSFRLSRKGGGPEREFRFRTLSDAGEVLFTFATFSDNHFKPDGVSWPDGRYFRRCADAHKCLVGDVNRAAPDFIINKGDLTDVYGQYRLRAYREAVRGLEPPTHCIPGNHDHLRNKNFKADWLDFAGTEQVYRSFDHKGFHFVLLDTCWTGEQGRGFLGKRQISWLMDDLERNSAKRTFVFTHHPVNGDALENRVIHDNVEFQRAISRFRNYITTSELTPGIPYIETAAVIQHPMGYNLYEVTGAGIKQVFKKLSDISLSEESWLASPLRCLTNPGDGLGKLSDRNFFMRFRRPLA
jgi:calcineurin-like phosphoesterase family protein